MCRGIAQKDIPMKARISDKLIKFIKKEGIVKTKDLRAIGISRSYLTTLVKNGQLQRVSRGLYTIVNSNSTSHRTLVEACKRVPNGVICLISALQFHDITTQLPSQVWIAIDRKAWFPKEYSIPLRIISFSGKALSEGIETHKVEGVSLKVYCVAKTIADCFKYRNKIGLDVAIEALRDAHRKRKCTMDEIWHFARICRVTNVIRPYLESIV